MAKKRYEVYVVVVEIDQDPRNALPAEEIDSALLLSTHSKPEAMSVAKNVEVYAERYQYGK